ncbi:glutamine--fructose-6-phosphate transaminase (isomerizing) [Marimonas sp. MJW-29]|uniref:Glutamine--fructose-6-phosphate aminotransferase [isomerizing] n=1 Tax=Sulfitobacter sediminis TaxID=3234186 RepID=A0ABV3RQL8_9RHOB
MCGIVGILGQSDVANRLLEGLARLEYRGYDSAGIGVMERSRVKVLRAAGKLDNLRGEVHQGKPKGRVGIGHTRWATHGAATQGNAHPHRAGDVTLVHNGIIENYIELRQALEAEGVAFTSETDTEVLAHVLDRLVRSSDDLHAACQALLKRIRGSYAIAVLFDGHPDLMFVARNGSPLAIGYGKLANDGTAEMYVGSDALAMTDWTTHVSYLEDGDWAFLRPDRVQIFDRSGVEVSRDIVTVPKDEWLVDKGPHEHFMLKEIYEQPDSLGRLLRHLFDLDGGKVKDDIAANVDFSAAQRIVIVACGTAHYASHVARYWIEDFAKVPVEIEIASEYRYRPRVHGANEIAIVVSQSGETADTLAALKDVREHVSATLAVVNVPTSTIAREADTVLTIEAGPEIGVASTKAFTGQVLALLALALKAGCDRGVISSEDLAARIGELVTLPRLISETLAVRDDIERVARHLIQSAHVLFLGRGIQYPIALEAALKFKEITYVHADGYAAGELKHGPIALVDQKMPVVVFDGAGALSEKTASNAAEVVARGACVIRIGTGVESADQGIRTPQCSDLVEPFVNAVVLQLLAYEAARAKGTDVDQPRNLAKSVTVE